MATDKGAPANELQRRPITGVVSLALGIVVLLWSSCGENWYVSIERSVIERSSIQTYHPAALVHHGPEDGRLTLNDGLASTITFGALGTASVGFCVLLYAFLGARRPMQRQPRGLLIALLGLTVVMLCLGLLLAMRLDSAVEFHGRYRLGAGYSSYLVACTLLLIACADLWAPPPPKREVPPEMDVL